MKPTRWTKAQLRELAKLPEAPKWLEIYARTGIWADRLATHKHCHVTCWIRAWLRDRGIDVRWSGHSWYKCPVEHETSDGFVGFPEERDALRAAVRGQLKGKDHA